jgi:hypothetical protein
VAHKAERTAVCNHCGHRYALYAAAETLWNHKGRDGLKQCPGTCTTDYTEIKEVPRARTRTIYEPRDNYPILPKAVPITPVKQFREGVHENWLNRWERKFGIRIPDENVEVLTGDRYYRESNRWKIST